MSRASQSTREGRRIVAQGDPVHAPPTLSHKKRVESRILETVEFHPALAAIREGRDVTDEQLVDLERTLHRERGRSDRHRYNADRIRFLRAVQELFLTQRTLAEAHLYEPPLTVFGRNA